MKFKKTTELLRIIMTFTPGAFVHESPEQKKARLEAEKSFKAACEELDLRIPPRAQDTSW